jgi:uncharacterized protein
MRLLRQAGFRTMPWKNGGGETIEIMASPEGAALDAFDWRISMARVAQDGPFSLFPGIDRSLSILEGEGMMLAVEGHGETLLTRQSLPFVFPGDATTSSRLLAGPILDLNVMTRRGRCQAAVARHHITSPFVCDPRGAMLLILLRGTSAAFGNEHMQDGDAALLTEVDPAMTLVPHGEGEILSVSLQTL